MPSSSWRFQTRACFFTHRMSRCTIPSCFQLRNSPFALCLVSAIITHHDWLLKNVLQMRLIGLWMTCCRIRSGSIRYERGWEKTLMTPWWTDLSNFAVLLSFRDNQTMLAYNSHEIIMSSAHSSWFTTIRAKTPFFCKPCNFAFARARYHLVCSSPSYVTNTVCVLWCVYYLLRVWLIPYSASISIFSCHVHSTATNYILQPSAAIFPFIVLWI